MECGRGSKQGIHKGSNYNIYKQCTGPVGFGTIWQTWETGSRLSKKKDKNPKFDISGKQES